MQPNSAERKALGPYKLLERIGRGGMATVYRAHHAGLDRQVAIKVLPEFFAEDTSYLQRFQQEARMVARLKHPNILGVFDFGQEQGITYLVLELVEGGTLEDQLGRPMDLESVVRILRPVASALDYAHARGVIHRDIKPSNILMQKDGTPILADFGLARMADAARRLTATGFVLGTPEYMAPEQAQGASTGPAADRYAIAIVAYEMLTGRVPFQGPTPAATLISHLQDSMPPTIELTGELSAHVEDVLRKGLSKASEDRYPSTSEFVTALTPAAWPRPTYEVLAVAEIEGPLASVAAPTKPIVLVVDDSAANRDLIEACLADVACEVRSAESGTRALQVISSEPPSLVLLDVQMPGMDGYEVCRRIKAMPGGSLLPVVMITALNQTNDRVMALQAGADDFLTKPVDRVELVARVRSALRLKSTYNTLDSAEQVIFALAAAVEAKDELSQGHAQRVADTARRLGMRLQLPQAALDALYRGAMICDIGKIAVPDAILLKSGPLNTEELLRMEEHPVIGENIVRPLRSAANLLPIIRHHHERFDGGGYPDGLSADRIPRLARIVAVCDSLDALVTERPYRPRHSAETALAILTDGAGKQWDPEVVEFLTHEPPTNGN